MDLKIKIDGSQYIAQKGDTILDVLNQACIKVPTMCYLENTELFPSCLTCLVKDNSTGDLIPSCSSLVIEGMDIVTDDNEVKEARKTSLELLLSDHVGECDAPCENGCPAVMDIPEMNRLIVKGDYKEAIRVAKQDIVFPGVLGRICPAPCERPCRRRAIDDAVSISQLERFVADEDIESPSPFLPERKKSNHKRIGIIGAGPAGLAAAYFLIQKGYHCTLFDKNPQAGGTLRYAVPDERLPKKVLDAEIDIVRQMGAVFKMNRKLEKGELDQLREDFDGVIVATGEDNADFDGLEKKHRSFIVERRTHKTNLEGVFAIGSAIKPGRVAIRAVAHGKEAALAMDQYLNGQPVLGETRMFNSRYGLLTGEDHQALMTEANDRPRNEVEDRGFTSEEAFLEAERCMHCDCRKKDDCLLRIYSDEYDADQKRYFPKKRPPIRKIVKHDPVIYEPEKCVKCGICVKITSLHNEKLGLTYIGKGFDVEIDVPFDVEHEKAMEKTARLCSEACPTGALALIDNEN